MNLIPATSLHDYEQEDSVSGFGDRERRRERRAARQDRKQQRRENKRERKVDRKKQRIVRKRQKVQERLVPVMVPMPSPSAPSLQPATAAPPPKRKPGQLLERAVDWVEEAVDEGEEEPFDEDAEEEDATEGFGAESWGPSVPMGRRLRIQAALGYRAAVIELKPGLYLVAEVPDAVTRQEFGLAPLLAPMMMRAARRSMDEPQEPRGPFRNLFRRRQQEPIRYVQVIQPAQIEPIASSQAPLALPGPTEASTMMVAAPNVGWADDATVAATYGCDTCARSRR